MTEEKIEEGTVILDPEMKKAAEEAEAKAAEKVELMKSINTDINGFLAEMSDKHGLKLYVGAYLDSEDEHGCWKTKGISLIEEMGLTKLIGNQF